MKYVTFISISLFLQFISSGVLCEKDWNPNVICKQTNNSSNRSKYKISATITDRNGLSNLIRLKNTANDSVLPMIYRVSSKQNACETVFSSLQSICSNSYCQNESEIAPLFINFLGCCSITYDASVPIPYFPGFDLYFINDDMNCTAKLERYLLSLTDRITDVDLFMFLQVNTRCWDKAEFVDEFVYEIISTPENWKTNYVELVSFSDFIGVLEFENQQCFNVFKNIAVHSSYPHPTIPDLRFLNARIINTITNENECMQYKLGCKYPEMFIHEVVRDRMILCIQLALIIEIVMVNIFVIYVFTRRNNMTPVSTLLSVLAASDMLTAVCIVVQNLMIFAKFNQPLRELTMLGLYDVDVRASSYPACIFHLVVQGSIKAFHMMSTLVTTSLSLHKVAAFLLPICSSFYLREKFCGYFSLVLLIMSFVMYFIQYFDVISQLHIRHGYCCYDVRERSVNVIITDYVYLGSLIVVLLSTLFLSLKLTVLRGSLPWKESDTIRRRNQRSAVTVVVICTIFLVSETFNILLELHESRKVKFNQFTLSICTKYRNTSFMLGFAMNFIVYLAMGQQIQQMVIVQLKRFGFCKKRLERNRSSKQI